MEATRYGIDEITKLYSGHVDGSGAGGAGRAMNDRVTSLVDSLNKYIDKGNPTHRSGSLPTYDEAVDTTPSSISLPPTFHDATRNPNVDGGGVILNRNSNHQLPPVLKDGVSRSN
ncbi:hypothetical protein ACGTRS_33590, partial [Burkholderia semiarida]